MEQQLPNGFIYVNRTFANLVSVTLFLFSVCTSAYIILISFIGFHELYILISQDLDNY